MNPLEARVLSAITLSQPEQPMPPNPPPPVPYWQQGSFAITLVLMPILYYVVGVVLWPGNGYSVELKSIVITAALISTVAAITGFWLAGSHGSKPSGSDDDPGRSTKPEPNPPPKP